MPAGVPARRMEAAPQGREADRGLRWGHGPLAQQNGLALVLGPWGARAVQG